MDDRFRVTDADRDHAAALLRDHFVAGRITAGELDARLTTALRAVTFGDLRRVLADLPDSPVPSQADRVPPQARLERGYRRRLALYPAAHRRVHEEEMLAVLMTQAPEGKWRPGIAETADLLLGALRVRCQPSCGAAEPAWRDALAVPSVILPVLILLSSAAGEARLLLNFPAPGAFAYGFPRWLIPGLVPPLALAAGALLGLWKRRAGALAVTGVLVLLASGLLSRQGVSIAVGYDYLFLAVGLELAALRASPGPRRGLQILTRKHAALVVIAALAVGAAPSPVTPAMMFAVIGVICTTMALASSLGRWLLVLLAIPGWTFFFTWAPFPIALAFLPRDAAFIAQSYLPSLILLTLAVITACRRPLHPV
jgi:uncharacterized protein DUF1707